MSKNAPFRYDFVGSFLRPAQLKQARADLRVEKYRRNNWKKLRMRRFVIW